ncbi:hypothetical protein ACIBBB_33415 [Streptomyces sp. NPDC051217]|uniref:hypothetical protein n=1 Tax=Streptomyces sp. NPDC051217 TaxID=3365644 RepID=UPI00379E5550
MGVGMHVVIPLLPSSWSGRPATRSVGADITADKHMEGIRLRRWLLSTTELRVTFRGSASR